LSCLPQAVQSKRRDSSKPACRGSPALCSPSLSYLQGPRHAHLFGPHAAFGRLPAAPRAASELEKLRRENELLKLNLEVVLEKVRAQEAELRTLRGLHARNEVDIFRPAEQVSIADFDNDGHWDIELGTRFRVEALRYVEADPAREVEAALKAFREARDPKARRCALEALDKAMKKVKDKSKAAEHPTPKKDPE
jgi:hypothetical protein